MTRGKKVFVFTREFKSVVKTRVKSVAKAIGLASLVVSKITYAALLTNAKSDEERAALKDMLDFWFAFGCEDPAVIADRWCEDAKDALPAGMLEPLKGFAKVHSAIAKSRGNVKSPEVEEAMADMAAAYKAAADTAYAAEAEAKAQHPFEAAKATVVKAVEDLN